MEADVEGLLSPLPLREINGLRGKHGEEFLRGANWPETITIGEALLRQSELPADSSTAQVLDVRAKVHLFQAVIDRESTKSLCISAIIAFSKWRACGLAF